MAHLVGDNLLKLAMIGKVTCRKRIKCQVSFERPIKRHAVHYSGLVAIVARYTCYRQNTTATGSGAVEISIAVIKRNCVGAVGGKQATGIRCASLDYAERTTGDARPGVGCSNDVVLRLRRRRFSIDFEYHRLAVIGFKPAGRWVPQVKLHLEIAALYRWSVRRRLFAYRNPAVGTCIELSCGSFVHREPAAHHFKIIRQFHSICNWPIFGLS